MSRGRKSINALSVVPLIPGQGRPEPPSALDGLKKPFGGKLSVRCHRIGSA